jgi:toxin-antitoxin system PIN domain toxin
VKGHLLDANVLLALAWPSHVHHARVQAWLGKHQTDGWATCAVTQLAFVRLSSQPAFSPHHKTPEEAVALLRLLTRMRHHSFWGELDQGFDAPDTDSVFSRIVTHHHVTDGWLVALATAQGGKLATLDEPLNRLFPKATALVR